MMRLFKKTDKIPTAIVDKRLAKRIEDLKRKLADYLNKIFQKLSPNGQIIIILLLLATIAAYCMKLLLVSF